METKTSVSLGIDPVSGLEALRVYKYFKADRETLHINVFYNEYLSSPTGVKANIVEKYYSVKNLKAGQIINNLNLPDFIDEITEQGMIKTPNPDLVPLANDFNGFDDWFNYICPNGTTLGQNIEGAIDQTLASLPIGCKSGWIITESN